MISRGIGRERERKKRKEMNSCGTFIEFYSYNNSSRRFVIILSISVKKKKKEKKQSQYLKNPSKIRLLLGSGKRKPLLPRV